MQRLGRRHRPFYRINAVDRRKKRDGAIIENLGWYDPLARDEAKQLSLNEERIKHWLGVGAQPSDTVRDILAKNNLLSDKAMARREADRKARRDVVAARAAAAPSDSSDG